MTVKPTVKRKEATMKNKAKLAAALAEKFPISAETANWLVDACKGKEWSDFRPELLERLAHFEIMARGRCVSPDMKANLEILGWTEGQWCNCADGAALFLEENGVMKRGNAWTEIDKWIEEAGL